MIICLKEVIPSARKIEQSFINEDGTHNIIPSQSSDDDFIAKIVSSHLGVDLSHYGYTLLHTPCAQHDFNLEIASFYQQNNWPFQNRSIQIVAQISNASDVPLFDVDHISVNPYGPLGDYLGYSTDEMLSDVSEQTTNHIIKMLAGKN